MQHRWYQSGCCTRPRLSILPGLYATVSGIDLAVLGALLAASRAFDGVTDPVIGVLSDRTRTSFGRRKPWIVCGALLCIVGVWFWFRPGPDTGALYFLLASVAVYLGWTMFEIPHSAWLSELSGNYDERAKISAIRTAAIYLGHVLFWLAPFMPIFATTEITPEVTVWLSYAIIPLIVATVFWAVTRVPTGGQVASTTPNLKLALSGLLQNRPLQLYCAIILSALAGQRHGCRHVFLLRKYLPRDTREVRPCRGWPLRLSAS